MTVNGSGNANEATRSTGPSGAWAAMPSSRSSMIACTRGRKASMRRTGERGGDEATQAGVIGRIDVEHVSGERRAREGPLPPRRCRWPARPACPWRAAGRSAPLVRLVVAERPARRRDHRPASPHAPDHGRGPPRTTGTGRPCHRHPTLRAPGPSRSQEPFFVGACELSNDDPSSYPMRYVGASSGPRRTRDHSSYRGWAWSSSSGRRFCAVLATRWRCRAPRCDDDRVGRPPPS